MFPEPTICTNSETLLGVIQGTESADISTAKEHNEITSGAASPDLEETGPVRIEHLTEQTMLVPRKYSDIKENLRSLT